MKYHRSNKEKVVVFGGSGFLGSHVADALSDAGFSVTIFDIAPSPWKKNDQEMIVGDLLDEKSVYDCLKGARYAFHFAGIADIGEAKKSPMATIKNNIVGSTTILECAVKSKLERIFFASTVYVYSNHGSFYRVSKQSVELLIEAYQQNFGLDYTILRYGSLYGPRSQQWNGLKKYVAQAVKEKEISYLGSGEETREYIHVWDAAKLTVEAIDPSFKNQYLTLTGTQVLTSKELLNMISEILGGKVNIKFLPENRDTDHYIKTPYRFTPRVARKIIPNMFTEIGQGILELIEEVYKSAEQ